METKKVTELGMLLAVSLILSYVETLIPITGVPGMKIGLANIVTVMMLQRYGIKEALALSITRVVLAGLLFGGLSGIVFGLAGAFVSIIFMTLMKKTDIFSLSGISMGGAISHNIAQLLVAVLITHTAGILYYAGPLLLIAIFTGLVIGKIAEYVVKNVY